MGRPGSTSRGDRVDPPTFAHQILGRSDPAQGRETCRSRQPRAAVLVAERPYRVGPAAPVFRGSQWARDLRFPGPDRPADVPQGPGLGARGSPGPQRAKPSGCPAAGQQPRAGGGSAGRAGDQPERLSSGSGPPLGRARGALRCPRCRPCSESSRSVFNRGVDKAVTLKERIERQRDSGAAKRNEGLSGNVPVERIPGPLPTPSKRPAHRAGSVSRAPRAPWPHWARPAAVSARAHPRAQVPCFRGLLDASRRLHSGCCL